MLKKIERNLLDAIVGMHKNINMLLLRGHTLNELEEESDRLLHSSESFVVHVIPWYRRFWFSCQRVCCPVRHKESQTPLPLQRIEMSEEALVQPALYYSLDED